MSNHPSSSSRARRTAYAGATALLVAGLGWGLIGAHYVAPEPPSTATTLNWSPANKNGGMTFNEDARLDTSSIDDLR